jgi:hypothetical protein
MRAKTPIRSSIDIAASQGPPRRQAVLVAAYADGFLEVFAEMTVDVHIARVPMAHSREGEIIAEDCFELAMPRRFRQLFRRDRLRANGTARPLAAETAHAALATRDVLAALTHLANEREEVLTWSL